MDEKDNIAHVNLDVDGLAVLNTDNIMELLNTALTSSDDLSSLIKTKILEPLISKVDTNLVINRSEVVIDNDEISKSINSAIQEQLQNNDFINTEGISVELDTNTIKVPTVEFGQSISQEDEVPTNGEFLKEFITSIKDNFFGVDKNESDTPSRELTLLESLAGTAKDDVGNKRINKVNRIINLLESINLGLSNKSENKLKNDAGDGKAKYKDIGESKVSTFELLNIAPEAKRDLLEILGKTSFNGGDDKKVNKKESNKLSFIEKFVIGASALIAGGAIFGLSGFFDNGPLKGLKKVFLRIFPKVLKKLFSKFGKTIIPKLLNTITGGLSGRLTKGFKALLKNKNFIKAMSPLKAAGSELLITLKSKIGSLIKIITSPLRTFGTKIVKGLGSIFKGTIGKVVSKVIPKAGKGILAKVGGKILKLFKAIKGVPILGALISVGFAVGRFKSGDTVGGLLELASGVASLFPGIGTGISYGIDALLAIRDIADGGQEGRAEAKRAGKQTFFQRIGSWIMDKFKKSKIYMFGDALYGFFTGRDSATDSMRKLSDSLPTILFTTKIALNTVAAWLDQKEEPDTDANGTPVPKKSMMQILKDEFKKKIRDSFDKAPKWLKGILKRTPGFAHLFKDKDDDIFDSLPQDEQESYIQGQMSNERKRIKLANEGFYGDEKDNEYVLNNSDKRLKDLQNKLDKLMGEDGDMAHDFIWRNGIGAQKFDSKDNILSVKSTGTFNELVDTLKDNKPSVSVETNQDKVVREIQRLSETLQLLVSNLANSGDRPSNGPDNLPPISNTGGRGDEIHSFRTRFKEYA